MPKFSLNRKPKTLFFAGTDTNVGKTYVAALIARRYREQFGPSGECKLGVYKPVASGCRREGTDLIADDAVALWESAGRPRTLEDVCPQRFEAPLAPTQAAHRAGTSVNAALLREGASVWEQSCDLLIVEGAGGLMSPLAEGVLNIDLVKQFQQSRLMIVAANRLGAIHQTLATCAAARYAGVEPAGIILCQVDQVPDPSVESNADEIARLTNVPLLGTVGFDAQSDQVHFMDDWFMSNK